MIFDLTALPTSQRRWFQMVLNRHTFDFDRCLPQLQAESDDWGGMSRDSIPVVIEDLSAEKWRAATWPDGSKIAIDDDVAEEKNLFMACVAHELGHVVDYFYLTDNLRAKLVDAYGARYSGLTWEKISHPFCAGFTRAFSDFDAWDSQYPARKPIPKLIREALT